MARRVHSEAGLTLLEILVVMAIFVLLTIGVAMSWAKLTKSQLKAGATEIAAELRYAFNRAMATGLSHRVVINLDDQTFRTEECKGPPQMRHAADVRDQADQLAALQKKLEDAQKTTMDQELQAAMNQSGKELPSATTGLAPPTCRKVASGATSSIHFSKTHIYIDRVWVAHLDQPAKDGTIEVNFFPQGYAEKTVVQVTDGNDTYSVVLQPITGHVQVRLGEWKRPEDFVHTDAQGTQQP